LVWQQAGIVRHGEGLVAAIAQIETWRQQFHTLPLSQLLQALPVGVNLPLAMAHPYPALRDWVEIQNLLDIALLILKSAAFRTESRGGHYRSDYPQTEPAWQAHTLVQGQIWQKGESATG
jgi:L-aspartate oxidase